VKNALNKRNMTSKMYNEEVARLKLYVEILGFVTCANILGLEK
jgi:hypothetical protein